MRHLICIFICITLFGMVQIQAASAQDDPPRPNIILILCDDMGYSDIGCYGGEIDTPNLDQLAEDGMRFRQFYNCAKCTTTRASIITGLHPRFGGSGHLRENMVTIPEVLGEAGYQTSLSGKWHLGSNAPTRPIDRGFDEFYGLMDGCCNFFNPAQPDPSYKGGRVRTFGHNDELITEFPDDYYTTDAFTDHAIEQVERFAANDDPFFVHLCYTCPHYPLHAKPEDIAKYLGRYSDGWYELRKERHTRQLEMGLMPEKWELVMDDPKVGPWEGIDNQELWELRFSVYAAMIDSMDQNIGRLLKALEATGEADNTLVLFLADNGGCSELPEGANFQGPAGPGEFYTSVGPGWGWASNVPFARYKSWVHEGGISTPLIARWPNVIEPGGMTDQVGHIIDFLPTFAELAGAEYPDTVDGVDILPTEGISLAPIFEGREREGHETLYWYWSGNRAIRQGRWKLVWDKGPKEWALYDMIEDRTETSDLKEEMPERAAAMTEDWMAWSDEVGLNIK